MHQVPDPVFAGRYVIGAWVILQVADLAFESWDQAGWPDICERHDTR